MSVRIIAGQHRGARIRVPNRSDLRPTLDRVRETVFNVLLHRFVGGNLAGMRVIDLFAGSGAYGFEALSRGAEHVTFVDCHRPTLAMILSNAELLRETERVTVLRRDACSLGDPPAGKPGNASLVFLDPPYGKELVAPALTSLAAHSWLDRDALCVIESGARESFRIPSAYTCLAERVMGIGKATFLSFSQVSETAGPDARHER